MKAPDTDRDVVAVMSDGRRVVAYHDKDWMPEGAFADEDYNPCGCTSCASESDTDLIFPESWEELV